MIQSCSTNEAVLFHRKRQHHYSFFSLPILTFCSIIAFFALSLYFNYWWENIGRILGGYWDNLFAISMPWFNIV